MRQRTLWFAMLWVLSAETALAQGYVGPTGPSSPFGQPGVDIYTTLNPRPPQSNVTQQSTTTVPTFDVGTPPVAPLGFPLSNVIVYPTITGGAFYDDNVFASNSNRQGDWATFVRPEYSWRSNNWTNIQAYGGAFVEKRWYNKFKSRRSDQWRHRRRRRNPPERRHPDRRAYPVSARP